MPFASREKVLAYLRNYNIKRRDKQKEYLKIYRQKNKETLKMKRVEYVHRNFPKIHSKRSEYYFKNRERLLERNRARQRACSAESRANQFGAHLYIMQRSDLEGYFKVGHAADPEWRAKLLGSGHLFKMIVHKVYRDLGHLEGLLHKAVETTGQCRKEPAMNGTTCLSTNFCHKPTRSFQSTRTPRSGLAAIQWAITAL